LEISGEHRFDAPREAVYEALLDPHVLRATIPGCEAFEATGPGAYKITLKVGIAAIRGVYDGTVQVAEESPPESYRLLVTGGGKTGKVQGDATMTLEEEGAVTVVRYIAEMSAQGSIARLGNRVLTGAAKLLLGQFFKAMERQVRQRIP
jgi:uncharacterized protein